MNHVQQCSFHQKNISAPICNGVMVVLIVIPALEMIFLFSMGAQTTNYLFGEDAMIRFLRIGGTSSP